MFANLLLKMMPPKKARTSNSVRLPASPKEFSQIAVYLDRQLISAYKENNDGNNEEDCSICLLGLHEAGMYESAGLKPDSVLVTLKECKHSFHESCLKEGVKQATSRDFFQCPKCKKVYGQKMGTQPKELTMTFSQFPGVLPGFNSTNIIQITYQC